MGDKKSRRDVRSQPPVVLPQVDPAVLRELAKKAQGLPPGQGMNMILKEIEKIDPKLLEITEDQNYKGRRQSVALLGGDKPKVTTADVKAASSSSKGRSLSNADQVSSSKESLEEVQLRKNPLQVTQAARKKHGSVPSPLPPDAAKIKVTEAAKKRRTKFMQRRIYEANERDDSITLSKFSVEPPPELLEPKPYFDFQSYRQLNSIAVRIHGNVTLPEIVLVGMSGTGKSELLEAILGQPVNAVGYKETGKTKRPLFFQVNSNASCDKPRTHIQFDSIHRSETVQPYSIPTEIGKHTDNEFSSDTILVQYDYSNCFNFAVIDTPGLPFDTRNDEYQQIFGFLAEILRPPNRLIVCVEEAEQREVDTLGGTEALRGLLKKIDPQSKRTVWVCNKLNSLIDTFISPTELNRFMAQTNSPTTYWTTLLSSKERQGCKDGNSFVEKLNQAVERDRKQLGILNLESQYSSRIGVNALRSHILEWAWNTYFNGEVPKLFKSLSQRKIEQDKIIRGLEVQMAHLNIRGLATQYTSRYLQLVQQVLSGTAKGNPSVNGITLKEELDEQFSSSEWDHSFTKDIPFQNTKLYGGQQFERLFFEFKAIASNIKVEDADTVALPPATDKKFFNEACEAAVSKVEFSMVPLIEQLIERATFIMKRVPNVVESILAAKDTKPNPRYQSVIDNNLFSPISAHFKDLFSNFIEKTSKGCKAQCMEEFFGTKTINWYMSNSIDPGTKSESEIFNEIFGKLRDRMVKNVLRKVYNFFLVPFMQIELWEEIQAQYFTIDSVTLDELLEIHSIEDYLDHKVDEQERARDKLESDNDLLNDLAPRFQN